MAKPPRTKAAARRVEVRRNLPRESRFDPSVLLERSEYFNAMLIGLAFVLVITALLDWGQRHHYLAESQVVTTTTLKRVDYTIIDDEATEASREQARRNAPRIYALNEPYLDRLRNALINLPKVVAGKVSVATEISQEIRETFELTDQGLQVLQSASVDGEPTEAWKEAVLDLVDDQLTRRPLLDSQEYQVYSTTLNRALMRDQQLEEPYQKEAVEIPEEPALLFDTAQEMVRAAGFSSNTIRYVVARLLHDVQPVLLYRPVQTEQYREQRAAQVQNVTIEHHAGEVLLARGARLDADDIVNVRNENDNYLAQAGTFQIWLPRLGLFGLVCLLTSFIAIHIFNVYPRVIQNTLRLVAMTVLMAMLLAATGLAAARMPSLLTTVGTASTLFFAMVILLAYDQRLALTLSAMQCALTTLLLQEDLGTCILMFGGCGTMILQLTEIRHRSTLMRAATITACVLGATWITHGLLTVPLVEGAAQQILFRALANAAAAFGVGFVILGILPSIERLFDITTGTQAVELRDSKQPLLRELQQRAPGTFNHSLTVSSDRGGRRRDHRRRCPPDLRRRALPRHRQDEQARLLHRKPGRRLQQTRQAQPRHVAPRHRRAREGRHGDGQGVRPPPTPPPLHRVASRHHARRVLLPRRQGEGRRRPTGNDARRDRVPLPRSPSPAPRKPPSSCSATASSPPPAPWPTPTPARIEGLVRDLSQKRLTDGQFDESDLSFRELTLIEDSMISRLCAIHHSRISYPSDRKDEEKSSGEAQGKTASA
jgi:membrane-associated HD superfamily phosphohydrolase